MSAFQLAKRRRRNTPFVAAASSTHARPLPPKPQEATPFSDDNSDDDHDDGNHSDADGASARATTSTPIARRVTSVSASPSLISKQKPHAPTVAVDGKATTSRTSQIGRLVERRRAVEAHVSANSHPQLSDGTKTRNEDVVFRAHLSQCADDANAHGYDSTPVDGFGESMLRAMGWSGPSSSLTSSVKGGTKDSEKDQPLVARPDRLGLGAKLAPGAPPPPPTRKRTRLQLPRQPPPPSQLPPISHTTVENDASKGVVATSDAQMTARSSPL